MQLKTLFEMLAANELSNLFMADGGMAELKDEYQSVVLSSINQGLLDLHTRFLLKREIKTVFVTSEEVVLDYPDLIEIISIKHGKDELCLNKDYRLLALNRFVLSDALNHVLSTIPLTIEYKAKPVLLTVDDIDKNSNVDLPDSYINALSYFIAAKAYNSIVNQLDEDFHEATRYLQKYQAEIDMLINQGIDVDNLDDSWLFHKKGFI